MPTFLMMIVAGIAAVTASHQVRVPRGLPEPQKVPVTIDLTVGADKYQFTGPAVCEHLAVGSIYDTPAERWTVTQDAAGQNLTMTVWRPRAGGENMLTLNISTAGKRYDVNTVRGGTASGSGSAKFAAAGKGGTFTIDATSNSGTKIVGTIRCEAFTASTPVAGD
jgi:hypothetical protein